MQLNHRLSLQGRSNSMKSLYSDMPPCNDWNSTLDMHRIMGSERVILDTAIGFEAIKFQYLHFATALGSLLRD